MRRLITYILLVTVLGIFFSVLFYSKAYVNKRTNDLSNLDYLLQDKSHYDIIFLGSSRVNTHINPRIIDSVTGLNTYNFGINGINILESRMILLKYLQYHPKPCMVILNIDHNNFYSKGRLFNATDLYPFLKDSIISHALKPYNSHYGNQLVRTFDLIQKIFATTDENKFEALFNVKTPTPIKDIHRETYKGFTNTDYVWSAEADKDMASPIRITSDEQGFELLRDIIRICRENKLNLILVHAPLYTPAKKVLVNFNEIIDRVKNIALTEDVPFLEFDTLAICQSKEYFRNYDHLNLKGANIYSEALAQELKKEKKNMPLYQAFVK